MNNLTPEWNLIIKNRKLDLIIAKRYLETVLDNENNTLNNYWRNWNSEYIIET
jgi:hypothetical protein